MIFSDVSSLFTAVPLDYTTDITMKRSYGNKVIKTKIGRMSKICSCYVPRKIIFGNKKMVFPWDPLLVQC